MSTDQKLAYRFSKTLIEKMFRVKPGETVAITTDSGSHKLVIDSLFKATQNVGGIPLVLDFPKAEEGGESGMKHWPHEVLTAALCKADVWIELNSVVLLYSNIWETTLRENKKIRYLIIADSSVVSLERVFTGYEIPLLNRLLNKVRDMFMAAKKVRITSKNGTDVSYGIDLNYAFDIDDGDFSSKAFGTAPGFVNIVPKLESMNGLIAFDHLENDATIGSKSKLQFEMKHGKIVDVKGGGDAAEKFKDYLASFEDENMYKISHNMIGLNPKITKLCGELIEDERIWGGVDFGFGHTSVMDMPPLGQQAKSHFDGVVASTSIYLDNVQIFDNGEVCHKDLKPLVENLLSNLHV